LAAFFQFRQFFKAGGKTSRADAALAQKIVRIIIGFCFLALGELRID